MYIFHSCYSWCPEWRQHEDDRRRAEDRPIEGPLGPFELARDDLEDEDNSSEDKDDESRLQFGLKKLVNNNNYYIFMHSMRSSRKIYERFLFNF